MSDNMKKSIKFTDSTLKRWGLQEELYVDCKSGYGSDSDRWSDHGLDYKSGSESGSDFGSDFGYESE